MGGKKPFFAQISDTPARRFFLFSACCQKEKNRLLLSLLACFALSVPRDQRKKHTIFRHGIKIKINIENPAQKHTKNHQKSPFFARFCPFSARFTVAQRLLFQRRLSVRPGWFRLAPQLWTCRHVSTCKPIPPPCFASGCRS